MTNVTTWSLSIPHTHFSLITTPDPNSCVYFITDILGYFGALNLQTSAVSVWQVPPDFWPFRSTDLEWVEQRGGQVWMSLANTLVNVSPPAPAAANQHCEFVAYFRTPTATPTVQPFSTSAFPNCGAHALDGAGSVWYGSNAHIPPGGSIAASVGCLSKKAIATYWDLPSPNWQISQVWPEDDGKTLWFTTQTAGTVGSAPVLGKLDAVNNQLTTVSLRPSPGLTRGDYLCLAGDVPVRPANIWFTTGAGLFRWATQTGQLFQYPTTTTLAPTGPLALNTRGVWVARGSTTVSKVLPNSQPTQVATTVAGPIPVNPVTRSGDGVIRSVPAVTSTATKASSNAPPAVSGGFEDYSLPVSTASGFGIIKADQYARTNAVWFSQSNAQTIGLLEG